MVGLWLNGPTTMQAINSSPSMSNRDAELIWEWLRAKYEGYSPTLATNLEHDLDVDSLDWLNIVLEIEQEFGVRLDSKAIGKSLTFRDILEKPVIDSHEETTWTVTDSLARPLEVIGEDAEYWLSPLT